MKKGKGHFLFDPFLNMESHANNTSIQIGASETSRSLCLRVRKDKPLCVPMPDYIPPLYLS